MIVSNWPKRTQLTAVTSLLALLSIGSGCCMMGHCGGGSILSSTSSVGCSGGSCGGCDDCGGGSEVIYPGSCGSCTGGGCGGFLLPLLSTRLACGAGCGGVYWNEWVADPPECCDSCDDCGCWVQPNCRHGCGAGYGGPCEFLNGVVQGTAGVIHHIGAKLTAHCNGVGCHGCADCQGGEIVQPACGGCGGCDACGQTAPDHFPLLTAAPSEGGAHAVSQASAETVMGPPSSHGTRVAGTTERRSQTPRRVVTTRLRR